MANEDTEDVQAMMESFFKKIAKSLWKGAIPEDFSYPYTRGILGAYFGIHTKATLLFLLGFIPGVRNLFYKKFVSERIVEDPFVLNSINLPRGSKILDFGCYSSIVPFQLASLGYKVFGVDYYYYPYKHPNFKFLQGDFLDISFKASFFECVYAISSIEHVGIGYYPLERKNTSDQDIVDKFYRILKPGGTLIVTVPVGKNRTFKTVKVYDKPSLIGLFKRFNLVKDEYFVRKSDTIWVNTSYREAYKTPVPIKKRYTHKAIACLVFKK